MLIYRICRQDRRELRKMNKEFGILLFQLSQSLERDEIDAIRFIEELPADLEGKSGLHVLVKLQMQGNITVTDPSTLQGVFKNINRMDLVNRVKEFIKSQKKKKRKIVPNYEELLFGLKANLAVSHLQAKLLCDQLRNQAYAAEMSGMTSVQQITLEAISFVENEVERRLICAKEEMVRKNNSSPELSDDDETQSRTLQQGGNTELASSIIQGLSQSPIVPPDREVPKYPTQEEQELDNDYYEEVPTRPRITTTLPMRHHYMVDNLSSAGTCTSPSNTYVKMNATHVTGTLNRDYPNTRDMSKPMPPPKPLSLKSPLRSQQAIENDVESESGDCSFSGGTYSGSESGFFEAKTYLRPRPVVAPRLASAAGTRPRSSQVVTSRPPTVPLPPKPHKYMPINTEQVQASYYKSTSREGNRYQKLVNGDDVESTKDTYKHEPIYENIF